MTELPMIDAERPWPGLLPFTEDARMFFHGREAETDDLFRLIEREPLTVLFGQSGLGKSSLLNAGVFPSLRRAGYLPVYLRLSLDATAPELIEQVWHALICECVEHEVSATPPHPDDGFWQYLHRPSTKFLNPHGRPVVSVLVFDQFEEIFTLGRQTPEQTARTRVLLQQLGELIENRLPPALESELTEHPELMDQYDLLRQNIKIVFTFREDYLADFEGLKTLIRPIMQNRMRLEPMRGDRAAEAIRQAGAGRLSAPVAARIVRFVGGVAIDGAGKLEEISVEPALLSLVCRELNEQRIARGQTEISADLIQGENTQQIIAQFYSHGFAGLDVRVRYFVEDRLLTAAGYRDSCALENALAEPGVSEEAIQTLVDRRILRREERGGLVRLELIHDVLAIVAKASRDARREAEALEAAQLLVARHRRRQRIIVAWAAVLVAALVGVSWLAVVASRGKKEAVAAEIEALSAQKRADQQAQLAIQQQQIAQSESTRAVSAEQLAKSKQLQLADALEKADAATHKANNEADAKEKQRWEAVVWAAAADEQLDVHGTGEQLRACVDSTNRLTGDPPPAASLDYMVGVWHVDQGFSSTDMDWRRDGTCVSRHLYQNGHEIDAKNDVCTWKYKLIDEHDFEVDYQSKMLGDAYPKQLVFKIVSPTRMRNTNLGYDAFRIICPAQEITIRKGELATLQKLATDNPGKLPQLVDLAGGFDKLGTALSAQSDSENALLQFNNELNIYQYLETREPANLAWQQKAAQLLEQIGDLQFEQAKVSNQAGNTQQSVQQATAALGSYQKSLALREQLLHAAPEDVDAQLNAAHVLNQLGIALYWSRQVTVAANAFRQRVRLLENIIDTHHGTPQIQVQLIWALYALSLMSDNATEARDDLTKSLAIATELDNSHVDPDEMVGVVGFLQGALAKLPKPSTPSTPPAPPKPPTSSKPN
jgi:tetratricopeptide (TPR) repeat protein